MRHKRKRESPLLYLYISLMFPKKLRRVIRMKRILLVCSAGMSTSLLVTKMQEAAADQGEEAEIWAVAEADASTNWEKADVLLLGPQVRFLENKIKDMVGGKIPVAVIDMRAYGMMDGKAVFQQALDLLAA